MTPIKTGVRLTRESVAIRHPSSKHNSCQVMGNEKYITIQLNGYSTIASMPSPLCRSQILIGSELGQYIPTVVHTVRELQL